jgi:HECT-domain (ubiquitin-transferase)
MYTLKQGEAHSTALRTSTATAAAASTRAGLASVIPAPALALLTGAELALHLRGNSRGVDIELLRANTEYDDGVQASDAHVASLWRVLHAFSSDDQRQFLRFVWAKEQLPLRAEDFTQKFKVQVSAKRMLAKCCTHSTCTTLTA